MKELISLRVWGRLACFTRPEMKVERVSYPLMTPSSARGILEAILWKPEVYYVIDSIRVIKCGQWTHFKRNEIQSRISFSQAKSAMLGRGRLSVIEAGAGSSDATPRNTLALRDVEYIISAEVKLTELGETAGEPLQKYLEEFKRRAKLGKCFHRPCLGMREFDAEFDLVEKVDDFQPEQNWTEDLGLMLYDLFLPEDRRKGMLPTPSPLFFHAKVENSVMDCNPSRVKIYGGKRKNVT